MNKKELRKHLVTLAAGRLAEGTHTNALDALEVEDMLRLVWRIWVASEDADKEVAK